MIEQEHESRPPSGRVRRLTDSDRILTRIEVGDITAGPAAARLIARRIERQGGFWDYQEKRSRHLKDQRVEA